MLAYLVKIIETFDFLERKFGEYFFKMPPKKRSKRRSSQEGEKMSTQAKPRSPEVDELSCVPETQQSQQAAGVRELVVGVEDPLEMLDREQGEIALRHCRIRFQVMRTLLTHRTHRMLGETEGQGQRQGQVKDQGRATCIRREG